MEDIWKPLSGVFVLVFGGAWAIVQNRFTRTQKQIDKLEDKMEAGFKEATKGREGIYGKMDAHRLEVKADFKDMKTDIKEMKADLIRAINGGMPK